MTVKAKIYNLSLSMLLLQRQVSNPETDTSNEAKVLNTNWDVAFLSALEDMDLDRLSVAKRLELLAQRDETSDENNWLYVYKYPVNCTLLRRLQSQAVVDNRYTHIPKRVGLYDGGPQIVQAIFTNEANAIAEIIPSDFPLGILKANELLAIAARLAMFAAPLIVGKGAGKLKESISKDYVLHVANAKETDRIENTNFESEATSSEFVAERLS